MVAKTGEWASIVAWAQDFVREVNERPLLFRRLFKLVVGERACVEFRGLVTALEDGDFDTEFI